jgi:hypothetical protein
VGSDQEQPIPSFQFEVCVHANRVAFYGIKKHPLWGWSRAGLREVLPVGGGADHPPGRGPYLGMRMLPAPSCLPHLRSAK